MKTVFNAIYYVNGCVYKIFGAVFEMFDIFDILDIEEKMYSTQFIFSFVF